MADLRSKLVAARNALGEAIEAMDKEGVKALGRTKARTDLATRQEHEHDFEQFWQAYDCPKARKVDKSKCLDLYARYCKDGARPEHIRAALDAGLGYNPDKQYRMAPLRWLRMQLWNDSQGKPIKDRSQVDLEEYLSKHGIKDNGL